MTVAEGWPDMDDPEPERTEETPDVLVIQDHRHAAAMLRQLARARKVLRGAQEVHDSELRALDDEHRDERDDLQHFIDGIRAQTALDEARLVAALEEYGRRNRTDYEKTFTFPAGRIETTGYEPRIVVDNPGVYTKWAAENASETLTPPTQKPLARAVAEAFEIRDGLVVDVVSGEVVPGLTVKPAEVTVTVKPNA